VPGPGDLRVPRSPGDRPLPSRRRKALQPPPEGTETAFVTLTRFEDISDVLAFAGEGYETPVLEPEALRLLSRYDDHALHFETATFSR